MSPERLGQVVDAPRDILELHSVVQPITLFLILKAFASGTTALTGVEAISNGIMAFKEPRSSNAGKTLDHNGSHSGIHDAGNHVPCESYWCFTI